MNRDQVAVVCSLAGAVLLLLHFLGQTPLPGPYGILVPLACLLVWAWVNSTAPPRRRLPPDIKEDLVTESTLQCAAGVLVITDKWDLDQAFERIMVPEGEWAVSVRLRADPHRSARSVVLTHERAQHGTRRSALHVPVDTGFVLFGDPSATSDGLDSEAIQRRILAVLDARESLSLRLRDNEGDARGIAVATGEGDGIYEVVLVWEGDRVVKIGCDFVRTEH